MPVETIRAIGVDNRSQTILVKQVVDATNAQVTALQTAMTATQGSLLALQTSVNSLLSLTNDIQLALLQLQASLG